MSEEKKDPTDVSYDRDRYEDIFERETRFDRRAYDFVRHVIAFASEHAEGHVDGHELLEYFRDLALDCFGPMAFATLRDWGVTCCEDVGAIVEQLCATKRAGKRENESAADFIGGYDFREAFLEPYAI